MAFQFCLPYGWTSFFCIKKVAVPDNIEKCKIVLQLSIQRYVFLSLFSNKCTQDVFQNVFFTSDKWATSRSFVKLFKNLKRYKKIWKQLCEAHDRPPSGVRITIFSGFPLKFVNRNLAVTIKWVGYFDLGSVWIASTVV